MEKPNEEFQAQMLLTIKIEISGNFVNNGLR